MTLEETTQLYASVLRQLLPTGGYDTSPNTEALAVDVYAHAKLLAQADLDGKRLLKVLEELPPELLPEYELEYGLPLKCTVNSSRTIEERLEILKWVRSTRNVLNRTYFEQVLKIFGVELFEFKKFKPMQCTSSCNAPVNTEQLRYKIRIVIPDTAPADMDCIIQNYFPGYLRIDVLKVPLLFKTSKPYALEHVENLSSKLGLVDGNKWDIYHTRDLAENIKTSITLMDAVLFTQSSGGTVTTTVAPENITTALAIANVTLSDVLKSTTLPSESVNSVLSMNNATLNTILISSSIQVESVFTSLTMNEVVLG